MARFLITCWSFPGHVFQPLAIARVLRERGHECAFYSGPRAARVVEGENFPLFPSDKAKEEAMYDFMFAPEQTRTVNWRTMLQFATTLQGWLLDTIPQQVKDLEPIISQWRPDVVVTEQNMLAPVLVLRETHKLPVAVLSYFSCTIPGPDAPPFGLGLPRPRNWHTRLLSRSVSLATTPMRARYRRAANEIRRGYGLPPLNMSVLEFTGTMPLYIVMGTSEFDYERRDLPPSVHYVGACLWDKPSHEKPSDWLKELPGNQPWVHASEGTVHVQSPFVLKAAAQGLANLPMQVILTHGRQPRAGGVRSGTDRSQCPRGPLDLAHRTAAPSGPYDYHRRLGHCAVHPESRRAVDYYSHGMGQAGYRAPRSRVRGRHSPGARPMHVKPAPCGSGTSLKHSLFSPECAAHGRRLCPVRGTGNRSRPAGRAVRDKAIRLTN